MINLEDFRRLLSEDEIQNMAKYLADAMKTEGAILKDMLSTTDYISWLEKFTLRYTSFSDDDWLYNPNEISEYDSKKVNNLNIFFEAIDEYATRNYIYPTPFRDYGYYYSIKFNNIGYEIGCMIGQGTLFFCKRVDIENEDSFIEFTDIQKNTIGPEVKKISEKLNNLTDLITSMLTENVPKQAIIDTVSNLLDKE